MLASAKNPEHVNTVIGLRGILVSPTTIAVIVSTRTLTFSRLVLTREPNETKTIHRPCCCAVAARCTVKKK